MKARTKSSQLRMVSGDQPKTLDSPRNLPIVHIRTNLRHSHDWEPSKLLSLRPNDGWIDTPCVKRSLVNTGFSCKHEVISPMGPQADTGFAADQHSSYISRQSPVKGTASYLRSSSPHQHHSSHASANQITTVRRSDIASHP